MTEHSEAKKKKKKNKSWGGVHIGGKKQTLRGTELALRLCGIILLILHILWKSHCGQEEPLRLYCLGLRNGPLGLFPC